MVNDAYEHQVKYYKAWMGKQLAMEEFMENGVQRIPIYQDSWRPLHIQILGALLSLMLFLIKI